MMKLLYSPASPFVRKVVACAIARGIDTRIEMVPTDPHSSPDALLKLNPLSKIPCLVTESGEAIYDSPVICEYLDAIGEANALFPTSGTHRWVRISVMHALADGIMDAAVARRMRFGKPVDATREAFLARQKAAVERGLAALEADPPQGLSDIGAIAVGCALGYLDFRFADEPWRAAHPRLAAWFAQVSELPPLARTAPPKA
ncbi:glutathione S-transferase N-terminal domain-containing protein [Falsiroseomonas oryziterrae]|uniref:glutathione S-transferase N-terminal domain-containing protein n=1 Tax=Falsiroseomonas oryziterrae TaxID=2911368 RepID=UPI001F02B7F3|nr:glutathione S-transferase N-terminal domain-containing protein [Roseomonas sp. NPKOSM-4]